MRLGPRLIGHLNRVAGNYGDDQFLAIRHDHETFVTNWVFGLRFGDKDTANSKQLHALLEQADKVARSSKKMQDIIYHIHKRGWMDILMGTGIYLDIDVVNTEPGERETFTSRGWPIMVFAARNGRRYYIRENYFDIAEEVIGDSIIPIIFRPISTKYYPHDYRPMLFLDGNRTARGLIYTITEENLRNPINHKEEYQAHIEATMPEIFG